MNADQSVDCLLEKELITEEDANNLKKIVASLPDETNELLKMLVALNLQQISL